MAGLVEVDGILIDPTCGQVASACQCDMLPRALTAGELFERLRAALSAGLDPNTVVVADSADADWVTFEDVIMPTPNDDDACSNDGYIWVTLKTGEPADPRIHV